MSIPNVVVVKKESEMFKADRCVGCQNNYGGIITVAFGLKILHCLFLTGQLVPMLMILR